MYSAKDIYKKLEEIEQLLQKNENPDGSCRFDAEAVLISLELARRLIVTKPARDSDGGD